MTDIKKSIKTKKRNMDIELEVYKGKLLANYQAALSQNLAIRTGTINIIITLSSALLVFFKQIFTPLAPFWIHATALISLCATIIVALFLNDFNSKMLRNVIADKYELASKDSMIGISLNRAMFACFGVGMVAILVEALICVCCA